MSLAATGRIWIIYRGKPRKNGFAEITLQLQQNVENLTSQKNINNSTFKEQKRKIMKLYYTINKGRGNYEKRANVLSIIDAELVIKTHKYINKKLYEKGYGYSKWVLKNNKGEIIKTY